MFIKNFAKKIIKLLASLFIIIFLPIAFVIAWLMLGHIEWQNLLKIQNKQSEVFFSDYKIEADRITTEGYGLKSLGTIFFRVNNFSLNDVKKHTIKIHIKDAYFSISIKDILLGHFLPIVYKANKVNIELDLDKIGNKKEYLDTQSLISYIVNYITTIVNYSLYDNSIPNEDIKNISLSFIKDNKKLTQLTIDNIHTSFEYKKIRILRKIKSVMYNLSFLVNNIPSNLQLECQKNIHEYLSCAIKIKNLSFDPIFNQANKEDNLLLSLNSLFNIEAITYIQKNKVKVLKGKFHSNNNFKISNSINKNQISINKLSSDFIITDNFRHIEINNLSADLEGEDIFYVDLLKADFLHKDKISILDSGNIFFKAHQFKLEKLYYYMKIFAPKHINSFKNLLNSIFIAPNANIQPQGTMVWENLKRNLPGKQSNMQATEYNIDIKAEDSIAYIPSLHNLELKNAKVDINLKPSQTLVKFNEVEAFNSKIDGIEIFYENNLIQATVKGKNQKTVSIMKLLSHIIHPGISEKINISENDIFSECDTKGKIKIPITYNAKKNYLNADIDLKITTKNFKYYNPKILANLVVLNIKKLHKSQKVDVSGEVDNVTAGETNPVNYTNCKLIIPVITSYKNQDIDTVNINNAEFLCRENTFFKANISYNNKKEYYIDIKKFKFFNNNFSALFFNNSLTGYHFSIKGEGIDLTPFLNLLSNFNISNFNTKHDVIDANIIKMKIKTDTATNLRNIFNSVLQKTHNLNKITSVNAGDIDIKFYIKDVIMLNNYHIKNFDASWILTSKDGINGSMIGEITNINSKNIEYLTFNISKNSNHFKNIYFRTSNINSLINTIILHPPQEIQDGDLIIKGLIDPANNIEGVLSLEKIVYRRQNAKIFKDVTINKVYSQMLYDYQTNIIKLEKGKIESTGIRGNFDASLNLNNEYLNFILYLGFSGTKYGIADIPILGNILTLSTSKNRYLSGFKYQLKGYLNQELEGSLKTLNGLSWLTGYLPIVMLALSGN